jgi:hypothetical protein
LIDYKKKREYLLTLIIPLSCFFFSTEFLEDLYHGEYPLHELARLEDYLSINGCDSKHETVNLNLLLAAVEELRNVAANQVSDSVYNAGKASEFTSNKLMREERYKHLRLRQNPDEKYSVPVTTSMAVMLFFLFSFFFFDVLTLDIQISNVHAFCWSYVSFLFCQAN